MIGVGDLLGPSATLAAVSLAVFAFSFPRAVEPVLWLANRERARMVALGVALDDHSVHEHHVDYAYNSGFVTTADIGGTAESGSNFAVELSVLGDRIVE